MSSFFSTFITGFSDVIKEELSKHLRNVNIILLTDGLVIYNTTDSINEIRKLKFLNNSFVLHRKFENVDENSISHIVKDLIKDPGLANTFRQYFPTGQYKFRIRAAVKNQFAAIDKNLLRMLEEKITYSARNFFVDRSLPDVELLITIRSEGFGLVGIQFTSRPNYEKILAKGELYPELAYILCLISDPDKADVFFDPFTGHGSIPAQRLNFPHKLIIAGEIDRELQKKLIRKFGQKVRVDPVNALNLSTFGNDSVDKIVTDPPWGLFDTEKDLPKFYAQFLEEFYRVLKIHGILVILTAQKELIENLLVQFNNQYRLIKQYSTLVSGKKAGVYKIEKYVGND